MKDDTRSSPPGTSEGLPVSKPVEAPKGETATNASPTSGAVLTEAQFLEQTSTLVYNLAVRLVGDGPDAEDLAQDSLIRALRALPSFRGECQMTTWVYRITVNTWKNRVRSEKRRGLWKRLSLDWLTGGSEDEGRGLDVSDDAPALDSALETQGTQAAVQAALQELEPESRAVVVLRDIEDLSYEEIALQLGLPVGTVKSRLSRAREALKERLKKHIH